MARGKVIVDRDAIRRSADEAARIPVRRGARKILSRSTIRCPVNTGRLRASGRIKIRQFPRGPGAIIEYPVKYALPVHDGSAPHIIRARRGRALRFVVDGQVVYARSVRHPGTQPQPFLRRAAQEVAAQEGWRFYRRG